MTEIIVVGFPKSGNTWLSRLLGDALDLPITGIEKAIPLAADQQERHGDGVIRQLHLVPSDDVDEKRYPGFVSSPWTINPKQHNGQHVIHIIRDPRDVAVAVNEYWEINDLDKTISEVIKDGAWPLWGTGWAQYLTMWRSSTLPHIETRYEWLHADTAMEIRRLCDWMGVRIVKPLDEVIQRQSIDVKRQALKDTDDNAIWLPHGKGAQLKNLRAGRVGDWRTTFTPDHDNLAHEAFGPLLIDLGYESDPAWHLRGVQTC